MSRYHGALIAVMLSPAIGAPGSMQAQGTGADTLKVSAKGNGLWGASSAPTSELQVGGSAPNTMFFGQPYSLAALPNGGVALFDSKGMDGPVLKLFDAQGRLTRTVGRRGAGPGEYGEVAEISVSREGTLLLWDSQNSRVNRYDLAGTFLGSVTVLSRYPGSGTIRPGLNGSIYAKIRTGRGAVAGILPTGFARYDSTGRILDSIPQLRAWLTIPNGGTGQDPREFVTVLPNGRPIVAAGDRLAFILGPTAPAERLVFVERAASREAYQPAERQAWQQFIDRINKAAARGPNSPTVTLPVLKPAFNELTVDLDGRIWFRRVVKAVRSQVDSTGDRFDPVAAWQTPPVFAVFRSDGVYLGEVRLPLGVTLHDATGGTLWAVRNTDDGEPVLVKYRIRGANAK